MITEHDLQEAIAECEGQRNPNTNTCLKLAAFYTIQDRMFPKQKAEPAEPAPRYSYAVGPEQDKSDFIKATEILDEESLLYIMDELMSTVKILMPKLYDGVMRKLTKS